MINAARQQALDKALGIKPSETTKRYKDPALNFKPSSGKSRRQENDDDVLGVDFLGRL